MRGTLRPKRSWHADHPLRRRHEVLTACGPYPRDPIARWRLRCLRAEKAALEAYLDAARACGLLDSDALTKLQGHDVDGYRAAVAECMTCWLLAGRLGLDVTAKPPGRGRKRLDMLARSTRVVQDIYVEVKAPFVATPDDAWSGNEASVLGDRLRKANEQFEADRVNVLVVVPELRTPIYADREQLVEAFIGRPVITWSVNSATGATVGETATKFVPDGELVTRWPSASGQQPRFTRISAIATIEEVLVEKRHPRRCNGFASRDADEQGARDLLGEFLSNRFREDHAAWIDHQVFVVHNPFAQQPLDQSVFDLFPQLVPSGRRMVWTDGYGSASSP